MTYNIKKYQFVGGPVIIEITTFYSRTAGVLSTKYKLGFTGVAFGVKNYKKPSGKIELYYFLDNLILNYQHYEAIDSKTKEFLSNLEAGNKLLLLEPIIGSGFDTKFLGYLRFSMDFGFGFIYRKYHFDNSVNNYNYLIEFFNYTVQFRLNIGFIY